MKRITGITLCLIWLLAADSAQAWTGKAGTSSAAQLLVRAAPDATYSTAMALPKAILKGMEVARQQAMAPAPVSDIVVQTAGKVYLVDELCHLYDTAAGIALIMPAAARLKLESSVRELRKRHYGELADWSALKDKLPRGAAFSVVDLITGQEFRVQRRAGSSHADVQPLTRQDTATMKAIYNGQWSWRRRAILVRTGSATYAASMHGMPHGGDGIPDNDFNGHFCIHFLGSLTHKTGQQDPDHEVMIHKAGGQLTSYVRNQPLPQLAELFLIALRQQDTELLAVLFNDREQAAACAGSPEIAELTGIRIAGAATMPGDDGQPLTGSAVVRATAYRGIEPTQLVFGLQFTRSAPGMPWILQSAGPQGRER